jgi:hypothetical protein
MQCIANCQYRCVTRKGAIIDIPESEMEEPIVKHNFVPATTEVPPALVFSNKNPLKDSKEAPVHAIGTEKKTADQAKAGENAGTSNGTPDPNQKPEGHEAPAGEPGPTGEPGKVDAPPPNAPPPNAPPPNAPPPPPAKPEFATMTSAALKAWLDTNQVQYTTRMLQAELVKLAEQAYALLTKEQ